jgi:hypothetical protein
MGKNSYKVTLTEDERTSLIAMTKNGKHSSRKLIHALILLNCDRGSYGASTYRTNKEVANFLRSCKIINDTF